MARKFLLLWVLAVLSAAQVCVAADGGAGSRVSPVRVRKGRGSGAQKGLGQTAEGVGGVGKVPGRASIRSGAGASARAARLGAGAASRKSARVAAAGGTREGRRPRRAGTAAGAVAGAAAGAVAGAAASDATGDDGGEHEESPAELETAGAAATSGREGAGGEEAATSESAGKSTGPGAAGSDEGAAEGGEQETAEAAAASGEGAAGGDEAESADLAARGTSPMTSSMAGKDDIDPKGNCSDDVEKHCKGVAAGKASLANCVTFHIKNEKTGNDDNAILISDGCKAEVRAFKIEMYRDLSMDTTMAESCKDDIRKHCDDDFLYPEPGNIVACLREVNQVDKLGDACKAQVLRAQMEGANDFKADPQLNELCSSEAERLCKGIPPGEGRIQECLRAHRDKLAWDCQAELFRQEVENADDIRLNVRLFQACLNDQRQFCADVRYGDARVKDCLESHRLDPDFSPRCKTEFDKMMERRAADFRLDSSLRKYCKTDISEICYPDAEDISDVANWDAKVIQCLQDYQEELKDPKCRAQVHKLTARAAEDIRFDKPLADACFPDRQKLCKDVPDGMAQVFLCLQEHQAELKDVCRSALFDELVRFAEDIDFKFPLKVACSKELAHFCKDVPQGHAARVQCLQEKIDDVDMGEDCRKDLNRDLQRSAEDYRLNYRLNKACFADVNKLCSRACDTVLEAGSVTCQGSVLKCLQENEPRIEADACKQELFNFNRLMVRDPLRFDIPLQRACADNISSLCRDVSRDHALTLACLRLHREELGGECQAEEQRFSIMEASDIRLTPTLMNACGQELQGLCKDVPPAGGAAFKCLQEHLGGVRMGAACKGEVNLQELRHASNYRLDVSVRTECAEDVEKLCRDADAGEQGHALVLRCMVHHRQELSASCHSEVAYAVRMALWQYKRNASLTEPCDSAVDSVCGDVRAKEINGAVIGAYGQCLVGAAARQRESLDPECSMLVALASQEGAHAGGKIDQAMLEETLKKISELHAAAAAAAAVGSDGEAAEGLVISGWMALAAVLALVVMLFAVAYGVYLKFFSPTRNYTLVVKGGGPV